MSDGGSAVVCDASPFNLRFLKAAMTTLGFRDVFVAKDVPDLEHKVVLAQPELVVFDPAMAGGGVAAVERLRAAAPDALLVAFCSVPLMSQALRGHGVLTVEKTSVLRLDSLIASIQHRLGRETAAPTIPKLATATPVWDEVPSLVTPV